MDVATNPSTLYAYHSGAWRSLYTKGVQSGAGAPTGLTNVVPPLYVDTTASPWALYVNIAGIWTKVTTPYIQYGVGTPSGSTPTEPAVYADTSASPRYKLWVYHGGAWYDTSAEQGVTDDELYFFGQL
jgi:hypothetical protein